MFSLGLVSAFGDFLIAFIINGKYLNNSSEGVVRIADKTVK